MTSGIEGIDVLYTPTDNTIASAYDLVAQIALKYNVPTLGAEENVVGKGGLVSIGIDYFKLGKETAYKAVEILKGKKPQDIKITTLNDMSITINEDVANKLGIKIQDEIKEKTNVVKDRVN